MRDPRRTGRLGPTAAAGEAGSTSCGDLVRIELVVDDGFVAAARFQAFGCPATIAGAAEVASLVEGRSLMEAARISSHDVAQSLDLSPRKRGCSNLAADALHDALQDAVRRGMSLAPGATRSNPGGVLVAMSGGVDSAVAALLMKRRGVPAVGVTFRLWSDPVCGRSNTCCSPASVRRARQTAHGLGLPHLTVDISEPFYQTVVQPFVDEYAAARTPNPCVRCNAGVRFTQLAALADRLGLRTVATGHYARLLPGPPRLARARDRTKDQSYVLAEVAPAILGRVEFPLGDLTKAETRALAREEGLEPRGYRESQEICFIPDHDHTRFLRERLGSVPGLIVDLSGRTRGRHAGLYNYTVGQRKGLGIAAAEPLYVVALDPADNRVIVGTAADLEVGEVIVTGLVRHLACLPDGVEAQLRSSGRTAHVRVEDRGDTLVLHARESLRAVAPGQTAVIYVDDVVAAAGSIAASRSRERAMV